MIFDQKAIAPGTERYSGSLYGTIPKISDQSALELCQDGYEKMLKHAWVKQAEVFMLQLLDKMVAIPIAVYYLTKSCGFQEVQERFNEVYRYATRDCFKSKKVCFKHQHVYKIWNCDVRPCEQCASSSTMNKSEPVCFRFHVLGQYQTKSQLTRKLGNQYLHLCRIIKETKTRLKPLSTTFMMLDIK